MSNEIQIETILKRDRAIVMSGLVGITVLAWLYIFHMAREMGSMEMEMAMPRMQAWGSIDFVLIFIMWAIMMVAMMIPSASPMILMFSVTNRRRREGQGPFVPTSVFLLGYLVVWAGFSALATLAQWSLHTAALLSPMMVSTSPILGGALLLTAGIFQWTPLKHTCLRHCRSPLAFLMTEWREGTSGAFLMGLKHGGYCVGCCWMLMSLLFVTGVMNLLWVAIIAAFILIEKVFPAGGWVGRIAGLLLIGCGTWIFIEALI